MDPHDVADLAELYLQRRARLVERRRRLTARPYRVHQAMRQWEE